MARDHRLPPSAACLSASMRDLGYSLETAVADLVDNSISADATVIDIVCEPVGDRPYLAIVDNGRGMDADEVVAANRSSCASMKFCTTVLPDPDGPQMKVWPRSPTWKLNQKGEPAPVRSRAHRKEAPWKRRLLERGRPVLHRP